MTTQPERIHHLLDRARRGVILPAEGEALATLIGDVEKDRNGWQARFERVQDRMAELEAEAVDYRAEVARLIAASEVDRRPLHARHVAALTDAYPDLRHAADHIANLILGVRDEHVRELEQRVAELTAGQCTHQSTP